jgi:hypothetical protein
MQKWEYKTIMIGTPHLNQGMKYYIESDLIGKMFSRIGTDGWELVVTLDKNNEGNVIAIFKRPC